eukprot:3936917-Rhodomonas_salina.1
MRVSFEEEEGDLENDRDVLLAHIQKKQRVLAVMDNKESGQKSTVPGRRATKGKNTYCGGGRWARGGRGGAAGGGADRVEWSVCSVCKRKHPGPKGGERKKLDELEESQRAAAALSRDKEEQRQHHSRAQYVGNKIADEYTVSFARWDPAQHIHPESYTLICLNVKQSKEYLEGAAVDSASPINIQNDDELAQLTCAPNIFLEGIVLGTTEVPAADCSFPTIDAYCRPIVLCTKGKGILHAKATLKVISLGGLLHSGCKVSFEAGRPGDHQLGGVIEHPNSTTVNMIYTKGIWRLP